MMENLAIKVVHNIWPMLVVFIVAISLIRYFYLKNHHEKFCFHKEFSYLAAIIYIWLLFEILTMTEINSTSGINIIPFSEILRYEIGSKMFYYNVLGNMIIFIPFGYLIGIYVNPKKIWPVVITTLLTSGVVEFVQLKIGRSFYIGLSAINKRLPDFCKSDIVYNLICITLIVLFGIYIFGYWGVIFNV